MALLLLSLMGLAGLGFFLSLGAHIASLLGFSIADDNLVESLHIGVFIVWFPAIFIANLTNQGRPRREYWKSALSGCPPWMRAMGYAIFSYAIGNFIWFILTKDSQPQPEGGTSPSMARGFSGH